MLSVVLRLSYSEHVIEHRAITGWFLPTTDSASWFRAIREIGVHVRSTKFFLAPTSTNDLNASGLVAIYAPSEVPSKQSLSPSPVPIEAVPLVTYVSNERVRLFIPSNGKVQPACESELKKQLDTASPSILVWLPQPGLIGFEPDDEIQPALLLRPPPQPDARIEWLPPVLPPQIPDRLSQISLANSLNMQQFFVQEQNQIGGDASKLIDIDDKGEPQKKSITSKIRDTARKLTAKYLNQSQNSNPNNKGSNQKNKPSGSGNVSGPSNNTGDSVLGNLSRYLNNFFNESLQAERDKQIEKLLRLMERNPDVALKYSIPMGGGVQGGIGRGVANSGAKLKQHDVDFSLPNAVGGGGAVDPWNIREDLRRRLLESYREQARREVAAGRHRRAAYIYAHLLGDFSYAAIILEQGKFYAEAAEIYSKHLDRPRDQARCLVAAAQFEAAAKILEDLGDHVAAGDLWKKIDEPQRAQQAYEKAVDSALVRSDILGAAKLLDEKLQQRSRAEQLLWQQWPYGQQTLDSALLAFRWLGEANRHNEALDRFQSCRDLASGNFPTLLARLCVQLFHNYPLATLKKIAEDQCRLSIAEGLDTVSKQERENRMEILRSLHPQDHYLQRDSRRFLDRSNRVEPLVPIQKKPYVTSPSSLPSISLTDAAYIDAVVIGSEVLAIGWRSNQLIATRCPTKLDHAYTKQFVAFANSSKAREMPAHLVFNQNLTAPSVFVSFPGNEIGFPPQKLMSTSGGTPWSIAESPYPQMLKATYSEQQVLWTISSDINSITTYPDGKPITFDVYSAISSLIEKNVVSGLEERPNAQLVHLCCVGSQPFFTFGNLLLTVQNTRVKLLHIFDSPVTHLSPSLPHSLPRLLVSTCNSLNCWYIDAEKVESLAQGNGYSDAVFLHGGRVVALNEYVLELYEHNDKGYRFRATEALQTRAACRLLAISVDMFGLLLIDGTILRWQHR